MNKELFPCPFCDGAAKLVTISYELNKQCDKNAYYVECSICYAKSYRSSDHARAMNSWNRRDNKCQ